ncbi:hypothetical protein [Pseudoalteromonas gelatinilytica]
MNINYIKLYFCLTLTGISIFATMESYYLYRAHVLAKEAQAIANQAERDAKAAAVRAQLDFEESQRQLKKRQAEQAAKQKLIDNAQRTNNEICNFWRNEYQKLQSDRNKSMMDGACARAAKRPSTGTAEVRLRGDWLDKKSN